MKDLRCPDCGSELTLTVTGINPPRPVRPIHGGVACCDCSFSATISDRRWIEAALLSHQDRIEAGPGDPIEL